MIVLVRYSSVYPVVSKLRTNSNLAIQIRYFLELTKYISNKQFVFDRHIYITYIY